MNLVEEAAAAMDVAALTNRLPGIQGELHNMEVALVTRVFEEISKGTLTPQGAHYAWLELMSYRRLARRLTTKVKMGTALMQKVAADAA